MNNVKLSFLIFWSNKMTRYLITHCSCFWIFLFNKQMTITTIEFRMFELRRRLFILNSCKKRTRSAGILHHIQHSRFDTTSNSFARLRSSRSFTKDLCWRFNKLTARSLIHSTHCSFFSTLNTLVNYVH
jgi:hypothetical protein